MEESKGILIFIHGISGSGKSTIGKELLDKLPDSIWIDQDTFYRKNKPLITFHLSVNDNEGKEILSNNITVENWDCEEAIDFWSFRNKIKKDLMVYKYVIVTGFALREKCMWMKADYSFLLDFDMEPTETLKLITKIRSETKFKTEEKKHRDYWMIREVVLPFYTQTLKEIQKSKTITVYDSMGRIDKSIIVNKIMDVIHV